MALESVGLSGQLTFDESRAVAGMGRASKAFRKLGQVVTKAGASVKRFSDKTSRFGSVFQGMGAAMGRGRAALQKVGDGFSKVASTARNAALALGGLTIAFGLALKNAMDFGRAVAEVGTIADAAEFPLSLVEETTLRMAAQFATAPVDQAKAMYQAISAGATTAADATAMMTTANELAIGGLSDTATSIDVLTTATNAYAGVNLEASDAADAIFTAVRAGKTTVDELGRSLGAVIPTASKLGIGFEELNAAVAAITTQGIVSAEATTGLNAALANMLKPSEQAKKTAKSLGIEFGLGALKNKGFATTLQDIMKATEGDEEALTQLFGSVRGVRAIMALSTNEGAKFRDILRQMEDRSGAATRAFEKMKTTTAFQVKQVEALRKVSFTTFGKVLEPLLVKALKPLGRMSRKFVDILEAVRSRDFDQLSGRSQEIAKGIRAGVDSITEGLRDLGKEFDKVSQAIGMAFGGGSVEDISKIVTQIALISAVVAPVLLALAGIALFVSAVLIPVFGALGLTTLAAFWPILIPLGAIALMFIVLGDDAWLFMAAMWKVGKTLFSIVTDFLFMPLRNVWNLATGVYEAIELIFSGHIISGLERIGLAIFDFLVEPFRVAIRTVIKIVDLLSTTGQAGWIPDGLRNFARAAAPDMPKGPERSEGRGFGGAIAEGKRKKKEVEAMLPGVTPSLPRLEQLTGGIDQAANARSLAAISEATKAATAAKDAAGAAADAASKKPCVKVDVDGREVARANAKNQEEVQARGGFKATGWQRRNAVVNGATPV